MHFGTFTFLSIAVTLGVHASGAMCQPSFQLLTPPTPGRLSDAQAVSADGGRVIGTMFHAGEQRPYAWTSEGGVLPLWMPPGTNEAAAIAISPDGAVATGVCVVGSQLRGVLWRLGGSAMELEAFPGARQVFPMAVSDDGATVAGSIDLAAVRWMEGTPQLLPGVPTSASQSGCTGISRDGTTMVGSYILDLVHHAFLYTESTGLELVQTGMNATASAISADGSTVVGDIGSGSGGETIGFRWQRSTGTELLGTLPGDSASIVNGVSADGAVVVGCSIRPVASGLDFTAFYWDEANGMRTLASLLQDAVPADYNLAYAMGVSSDGSTVVGVAETPCGPRPFIARLDGPSVVRECYADCSPEGCVGELNVADFTCFLQRFAAGDLYANCDRSTASPVLNVGDFTCFLQQLARGCY